MKAAGISKGSGYHGHEWVGAINMKQVRTLFMTLFGLCYFIFYQSTSKVYHISKNKKENDPRCENVPLDHMCLMIMKQADKMCVAILRD